MIPMIANRDLIDTLAEETGMTTDEAEREVADAVALADAPLSWRYNRRWL